MSRIFISAEWGRNLPHPDGNHMDSYDGILITDEFDAIGVYQMPDYPDRYYNAVRGVSVSRAELMAALDL